MIDIIMVTNDQDDTWPESRVHCLLRITSHNMALLFSLENKINWGLQVLRYEVVWFDFVNFDGLFKGWWEEARTHGSQTFMNEWDQ